MKKDQIKKNINHQIRLRPITKILDSGIEIKEVDDDWIIERIVDEGIQIKNMRTSCKTTLGFDQIYSYTSDPNRNYDGLKYGFLVLLGQLCIEGEDVSFEPTERPGKPSTIKDIPLNEAIDWSKLTPAIRSYLIRNDIISVSDARKIDLDNIMRQKNIGKKGVRNLVHELVVKGILKKTDYIKRFL